MANYNLVTTGTFQPFTYNELMAPIQELEKQYAALESGFDTLHSQTLPIGSVLTDMDNIQKQQYENYINNISSLSEELATKGYSNDLARKLVKAKNDYITIISPISAAVKNRATQIEKQAAGREKDPTVQYSYIASETPLSRFIENPNLLYKSFSGEKLAEVGEDLATHFMNDLRGTSYSDIEDLPGMVLVADTYGYTPQEMIAKFKSNPNDPIVSEAMNKVLSMSGIYNWEGVLDEDGEFTDYGNNLKDIVLNSMYSGAVRKSDRQVKTSRVQKPKSADLQNDGDNSSGKDPITGLLYSISPRNLPPNIDEAYNSLYSFIDIIDPSTKRIKEEYGNLNTAIQAYEELQVLNTRDAEKGNITYGNPIFTGDTYITPIVDTTIENKNKNIKTIKEKYGISNVLTDDEYNTILKYASTSSNVEEDILNDLNESTKLYIAYSINLSNYDAVGNKVLTNLQRLKDSEQLAGSISTLKGEDVFPEDLPDLSKSKVKDLEYSPRYPGKLIVNIDGKDYVIDPSLINETAQSIVNNLSYNYSIASSDNTKKDVINTYLGLLIKVINSENPVAPSSSSEVGILGD